MDVDVGSNDKKTESMSLRRKVYLGARPVDTTSLLSLGQRLNTIQQLSFTKRYGNLLSLMRVRVQEGAITALAQFYDPPLRCFTFQDFQLAPTLEEYEQIFGQPLEDRDPYRHIEHRSSPKTIATALQLEVQEVKQACQGRNQVKGFDRAYLEKYMHYLADNGNWETFMDVLALTIFGIMLFPSIEGLVDLLAVDVFLACKNRSENPVPALLADVYCTLNFCHTKKGKKILCCLPILYVWLTSHVFRRTLDVKCPIADLFGYPLDTKEDREWADHLASLTEGFVRWHPSWQQRTDIIYHCKGFPNVPLMGTKGCINYNPVMGQRQIAYPMLGPPAEELLSPFVFYYDDGSYTEQLRKIRDAWSKVTRKGKELGARSCAARGSYRQWVKERVQQIKLPFKIPAVSPFGGSTEPEIFEDEEVKELKAKLAKMTENNKKLEEELLKSQ